MFKIILIRWFFEKFRRIFYVFIVCFGGQKNKFKADKNWIEASPCDFVSLNISYRVLETFFQNRLVFFRPELARDHLFTDSITLT